MMLQPVLFMPDNASADQNPAVCFELLRNNPKIGKDVLASTISSSETCVIEKIEKCSRSPVTIASRGETSFNLTPHARDSLDSKEPFRYEIVPNI